MIGLIFLKLRIFLLRISIARGRAKNENLLTQNNKLRKKLLLQEKDE